MEKADETLLTRYAEGDVAAREEIALRHMPLARRLAKTFRRGPGADSDDEQVAYIGLLKAIDRYQPDAGEFIAFAIMTIRGELKRHRRDHGWALRLARPVQERYLQVSKAMDTMGTTLQRAPTPAEIAEATKLSLEEVIETLEASSARDALSLNAPVTVDGEAELADTFGVREAGYERVEISDAVQPAFEALPEREQLIVRLRFAEDLTQTEIASRLGLSQMHVSRLLRRALTTIADPVIEATEGDPVRG